MDLLLYAFQLIVILLFLTNANLSGANKAGIASFLGSLWVGCVVAAVIWFGWDGFGFALGASVVGPVVLRGPAVRLAAWLMGLGSPRGRGAYPGPPPLRLTALSRTLGDYSYLRSSKEVLEELTRPGPSPKDLALDELIKMVGANAGTRVILDHHGILPESLKDTYHWLCAAGAAQWAGAHFAAASALFFPRSLDFVLSARQSGVPALDVAYAGHRALWERLAASNDRLIDNLAFCRLAPRSETCLQDFMPCAEPRDPLLRLSRGSTPLLGSRN